MSSFKRTLNLILAIALISLSLGNVQASIVSNNQIINKMDQAQDRATLLQTIKREDVQAQLTSMGVSVADVEARIDQMTSEEIAQLNERMAEMPAGAGVLGIVFLVFVIFVITDVIGATDIFPFIHPVN